MQTTEMATFKEATDVLGLSAAELARIFSLKPQTIRQMRMDPDSDGYRPPPEGWRKALAPIAREKGTELGELAGVLEQENGS